MSANKIKGYFHNEKGIVFIGKEVGRRLIMELNERKVKILQAVIRNYLETGEPVGSRTISKYTDLNLSSATIRNEMSDLEELGYIMQPHTSAGRIPTDKGYRLYVDKMMQEKLADIDKREKKLIEREELLIEKVDKVETLLKNMAKMLATDTNYAAMITTPTHKGSKIKFIQISRIEANKLLCVVVSEGNLISNKMLDIEEELDSEEILKINMLVNTSLAGLTLEEINLAIVQRMENKAGSHTELVREIVQAVMDAIKVNDDLEIYTSGATNIFKYPELSDKERASMLLSTFEDKQPLTRLISDNENETGIQVYIGDETPIQTMKDCSVVTATYELEDGIKGTIGIIGPKRMDYERVVETLRTVKEQLSDSFRKKED